MKKSLLTLAAALTLAGCSQDDLMKGQLDGNLKGAVGANIFVPTNTRGAALEDVDDLQTSENGFDLLSYYNDEDGEPTHFLGSASDEGIEFLYDAGNGVWDYADRSEMKFWQDVPEGATDMKFFAVSPTKDKLPSGSSYQLGHEDQTITYQVPETVSEQMDLMFAHTELADDAYGPSTEVYNNGVPLHFHHALSQIVFMACIDEKDADVVTAEVNSITLKNVYGSGTFNMTAASAALEHEDGLNAEDGYTYELWTGLSDIPANGYIIDNLAASITSTEAEALTDGDVDGERKTALLLIPQTITGLDLSEIEGNVNSLNSTQFGSLSKEAKQGVYLEVSCRVTFNSDVIVGGKSASEGEDDYYHTLYIPINKNWNPGYKYVYTLVFGADSGDPVKADVKTVDKWSTPEGDGSDDGEDNDESDEGDETPEETYKLAYRDGKIIIASAEDLAAARDYINEGAEYTIADGYALKVTEQTISEDGGETYAYNAASYLQTADIDLSSVCGEGVASWEPIGNNNKSFRGRYDGRRDEDGGSYEITNLYISYDANETNDYIGLFGKIAGLSTTEKANLCNLKVSGIIVNNENSVVDYVGGLVGTCSNTIITNCSSSVAVTGGAHIGGIAGSISISDIIACVNEGPVSTAFFDAAQIGGIIGSSSSNGEYSNIVGCYNTGNVENGTERAYYMGGVLGNASFNTNVYGCYNTGDVDGGDVATGAIVGLSGDTDNDIQNCFWGGNCSLSQTVKYYDGGEPTISNCAKVDDNPVTWGMARTHLNNAIILFTEKTDMTVEWHYVDYSDEGSAPTLETSAPYAINPVMPLTGNGTEESPYEIPSAAELCYIAGYMSEYTDVYFKQTADIDLDGVLGVSVDFWQPIGSESNPFDGNYDGCGFSISGLDITDSNSENVGLFGKVENATISNVRLVNSTINVSMSNSFVAGVVGYADNSVINNCTTSSDISISGSNGYYVGGIVARAGNATKVMNCVNKASLTSSVPVGGIAGSIENSSVMACYNVGSISTSGLNVKMGGIIGECSTSGTSNMFSCYNTGSVANGDNSGAIIGYCYGAQYITVSSCYWGGNCTLESACTGTSMDGCVQTSDWNTAAEAMNQTISNNVSTVEALNGWEFSSENSSANEPLTLKYTSAQ